MDNHNREIEDVTLVEAVRTGHSEAYGLLVERYYGGILARCRAIVGDPLEAEELAHQAFVDAYVKLDQLRDSAKFLAWLRMLALNLCRMWYRRRKHSFVNGSEDEAAAAVAEDEDERDYAQLALGLNRLNAQHRVVLVLHYFEKLSYKDMAAFLQVPVGTVMSRLSRARQALKEVMENMTDMDETGVTAPDDFRRDIEAEIALLLKVCHDDREAMHRLSVVLRQSPERFMQLVREAEDEATLTNLAQVLPHLGADALQACLRLYLSHHTDERHRARTLMCAFVARCSSVAGTSIYAGLPSRNAYRLVDSVISLADDDTAKARLLLELLQACGDVGPVVLLTNVLLCYPEAAVPALLDRYWSMPSVPALYESPDILYALCRTGTRFCRALIAPLSGPDPGKQALALAGVEGIGGSLVMERRIQPAPGYYFPVSPLAMANDHRTRRKWAPLLPQNLDSEVMAQMIEAVAPLVEHDRADIRESALRALGLLRAQGHLARIRSCASHDDPRTQRTAVLALAHVGDTDAAELLMQCAATGESSVRRAALEALTLLNITESQPLLIELIHDADAEVRRGAAVALATIGDDAGRTALRALVGSKDPEIRKAVGKSLMVHGKPWAPTDRQIQIREKMGGPKTLAITYKAMDAALRFAIPEIRPYDHQELTQRLRHVCGDHALARRDLIDYGVMERTDNLYTLTEFGKTAWRVEHFILDQYLGGAYKTMG